MWMRDKYRMNVVIFDLSDIFLSQFVYKSRMEIIKLVRGRRDDKFYIIILFYRNRVRNLHELIKPVC